MIVDAVFPQLFAAVVRIHVKSNRVLFPRVLIWPQLDEKPPSLERDLANVDPGKITLMLFMINL